MCLGAVYWARPAALYYAATRKDAAAAGFDDDLIYTELARPASDRSVTMHLLLREEAAEPFRIWMRNPDRTPY